jgi:hypothetical protein
MSKEAIAIKALEVLARLGNGDKYGNSTGNTIARTALAEISRLAEQPAPVQPVLKPLSKKWKWVLHESFADVAGFDEEGIPSFYWKESVNKFKSGELSAPCKGKNCGSLNGWLHSSECRAEHEAQYTTPPAAPKTEFEEAVAACDNTLHYAIDHWQDRALKAEAKLAQPEQEPVAWLCGRSNGDTFALTVKQLRELGYGNISMPPFKKLAPLFTALEQQELAHDRMMDDALTIGSAWSRGGERIDPTSVYTTPPPPAAAQTAAVPLTDEDELSNGLAMALHDAVLIRIGKDDEATRQAIARIDKLVAKYKNEAAHGIKENT